MKSFSATATVTDDHRMIVATPPDLPPGTVDVVVVLANSEKHSPLAPARGVSIEEIGWTREQAAETRAKLASFAEDWEAPGMEAYDEVPSR